MAFEILKPAKANEGFHGILYGEPKVGKTSTLDDPNYKVLILDLEGGSAVLSEAENVDRIPVDSYETVIEVGKAIQDGKLMGYDLIAIDSLSRFEDLVKEYVATKYAPSRRREITNKFGAQADWGDLKDLITKTVKWFHSFTKRGDNSVHILWIAHVAKQVDELTKQVTATKVQLQGSTTAEVVMSIVDGLFYMYNKAVTAEDGKHIEVERGILTKQAGVFVAGTRQSKKRDPLPAKIVNPVWSEIFATLGYDRK